MCVFSIGGEKGILNFYGSLFSEVIFENFELQVRYLDGMSFQI